MLVADPTRHEAVDRCEICGSERFRTAFVEPPYSVRRCEACGFGWTSPRMDADGLAEIYGESYWQSSSPKTQGYHDYRAEEPRYLKTFRRRLRFALRNGPQSGPALDVGCAAGFCMKALQEMGFEAHGVEISPVIASYAQERFGFDTVHIGTLESAPYEDASFDVITMWDVVEHVVDPRALLQRARALVKPDGVIVLETQNIDSTFARLLGPRWHHYKHAEHVYHFTPATFTSLLEECGFTVRRLTPRYGGKYVSLDFIAERAGRLHPSLSRILAPLSSLDTKSLYVNVMDEMLVVARPAPAPGR